MKQYGLLGKKLGHSWSPEIHGMLGDYDYRLFERAPESLTDFLQHGAWQGLNVTVPYKKTVVPFCDELSDIARQLGSVNTLVRRADGSIFGDNTDAFGFETLLRKSGLSVSRKKVLVLGSGGASVTVCAVLRRQGAEVVVISRTGENNYGNLSRHRDARLIINTTPVGMYPRNGESPLALIGFPACEGVVDIIYNPLHTALLCEAERYGLKAVNGLIMLVAQALRSSEQFLGVQLDERRIDEIEKTIRKKCENIVLIGMPGCGKSTVGMALSEKLGRPFVDTDQLIEERIGQPLPDFFAAQGEEAFRRIETEVICEVGKRSGIILATGGGCVTRAENYEPLHQNGRIVWLMRDVNKLPTDGRPISQKNNLTALFLQRKEQYERFADCRVDQNGSVDGAVQALMEEFA